VVLPLTAAGFGLEVGTCDSNAAMEIAGFVRQPPIAAAAAGEAAGEATREGVHELGFAEACGLLQVRCALSLSEPLLGCASVGACLRFTRLQLFFVSDVPPFSCFFSLFPFGVFSPTCT
jgi:hypothetical protein